MGSRLGVQVYEDETEPLYLVQVYKCIVVNLEGHSKLFQGGVAQVYIRMVSRGSGGILPHENFVKLDARRSLLRQFLGPKSNS